MRRVRVAVIFGISLALATLGLGVLSREAIRADRARETLLVATQQARQAEAEAKRAIERRDLIGRAVWRLDTMLTPLVAQESTRPADLFLPSVAESIGKDDISQVSQTRGRGTGRDAAPLPETITHAMIDLPNEYVALHFQVDGDGVWTSPQVPATGVSVPSWLSADVLQQRRELLNALAASIDVAQLQQLVPEQQIKVDAGNLYATNSLAYNGVSRSADVGDASAYRQDSLRQLASQTTQSMDPSLLGPQGFRDWDLRNRLFENFANTSLRNQRLVLSQNRGGDETDVTYEGVTRPIWLEDRLFLVRRWHSPLCGDVIQGCCLDWARLKQRLLQDIQDLLPKCDLVPVLADSHIEPTQLLATLPLQLVVTEADEPVTEVAAALETSQLKWMLGVAWIGLVLAALAGATVIFQTESLAARRAEFVSSVTHELRTPLTTFRMYTEMLDSGMVPPGDATRNYVGTLRREAERLHHLVENVLAYARLEHGRKRREAVSRELSEFLTELEPRLAERAELAGMRFQVTHFLEGAETEGLLGEVNLDPLSVEQILFNLVDNACKYARSGEAPTVELRVRVERDRWEVAVLDRGPGIRPRERGKLFRFFSKTDHEAAVTAPGIGLGLALSRRLARELGGRLDYRDRDGGGAAFTLELPR